MDTNQIRFTGKKKPDPDRAAVIGLFLKLFKHQCGADPDAPAQVAQISPEDAGPDLTYELRVHKNKKWERRRMSVGIIGENPGSRSGSRSRSRTGSRTKGSKSTCFKITYDTLLVVKVPPAPIRKFDDYTENLHTEGRIAVKLEPEIEFVAPGVTAIMRKVHPFKEAGELKASELEARYIDWLRGHPSYQDFLKISGGFVFVMDLSKYAFLSQVVEAMHDPAVHRWQMGEEILKSHNLLWDILAFENKYGDEHLSVCFNINKVYAEYETRLSEMMADHDLSFPIPAFRKQEWFLFHLAERGVARMDESFPEGFLEKFNNMVKGVLLEFSEEVDAYREMVLAYVRDVSFIQNKNQMAGLIYNILHLLAHLRERQIAIRDLKPDNLFVVAEKDRYPLFVASPEESSLGLIDFETAVDFTDYPEKEIPQPLLAGTPAYATPSHLFPNRLLGQTLTTLPLVFNYQDWQAAVAMIYNIVTGELLFEHTRKLLFKTKKTIQRTTELNLPLSEGFKEVSRMYWSGAVSEFEEKISAKKGLLKSIPVNLSPEASAMIREDIEREHKNTQKQVRKYVDAQVIFHSDKNRQSLLKAPAMEVARLRERWERGENLPKMPPGMRTQILRLLRDLERLKAQSQRQKQLIRMMEKETTRLSAYDLSKVLFDIVFNAMYREEWGALDESDLADAPSQNGALAGHEPTILYEETMLFEASG
jgi:serine/threonine protein kinase